MFVKQLTLKNFRNYSYADILPNNGVNVITGQNAQGKTNLVEAIHLLSTTKPIRSVKDPELVMFNSPYAEIKAEVEQDNELSTEISMLIKREGKREVKINRVSQNKTLDILGRLVSVTFSSQDLEILYGEPSARRKFLDLELAQIRPGYGLALGKFKRTLEQRNDLLRKHAEKRGSLLGLDIWNEQFIKFGVEVMRYRSEFIKDLAPYAEEVHKELSKSSEKMLIQYVPNIPEPDDENDWEDRFADQLEMRSSDEIRRGLTLTGPQRDDFQLTINELDARVYASQGQQRTVVLSLRLGQAQLANNKILEPPVVILDDVMSDLDDHRKSQLMAFLSVNTQVFITCTELHAITQEILSKAGIYRVSEGSAERL